LCFISPPDLRLNILLDRRLFLKTKNKMKRILTLECKVTEDEKNFDRVEYQKDAKVFRQEELSYEQLIKIMSILKPAVESEVEKIEDNFEFMTLDLDKDKLINILAVSTGVPEADLVKFKLSELEILRDDFFFLNPELTKELATMSVAAAFGIAAKTSKNLENILKVFHPESSEELLKTSSSLSPEKTLQSSGKQKK
jgi:hypothetical protein